MLASILKSDPPRPAGGGNSRHRVDPSYRDHGAFVVYERIWVEARPRANCSAFVRYCYKEAGKDFMGAEISVSNTTPEDIAQAGIQVGALKRYVP